MAVNSGFLTSRSGEPSLAGGMLIDDMLGNVSTVKSLHGLEEHNENSGDESGPNDLRISDMMRTSMIILCQGTLFPLYVDN